MSEESTLVFAGRLLDRTADIAENGSRIKKLTIQEVCFSFDKNNLISRPLMKSVVLIVTSSVFSFSLQPIGRS